MPEEENSGKPFTRSAHRQGHSIPAYRLKYLTPETHNYGVHRAVTTAECVLGLARMLEAGTCSGRVLRSVSLSSGQLLTATYLNS